MIRKVLNGMFLVLLLAGFGYTSVQWFAEGVTGQDRVMLLGRAAFLGLVLLLWISVQLPKRWRNTSLVSLALVALFAVTSLRITGVTGDLMPILGLKWGSGGGSEALRAQGSTSGVSIEADFPQFLGPARDARLAGPQLATDWKAQPPKELWRIPVGEGWSSFAVQGRYAVTQEQHGGDEQVVAYDWRSGERLWSHGDADRYETTIGGIGPRATPTLAGGMVYTMGARGLVTALDLATGALVWQHDMKVDYGAKPLNWGNSASPLVVGEQVIVSSGGPAGQAVLAFDRHDGSLVWSSGRPGASYASPAVLTLAGEKQLVVFHSRHISGYRLEDGAELWEFPWPNQQPNVAQPVVVGPNRLLASSGYGTGAKVFEITREDGSYTADLVWESPRLKAKFTNVVFHQGSVYGLDDGVLVCLDPETGERRWKKGRYGHGQLLLVGNDLLIVTEDGHVVIGEALPDGWQELSRIEVFDAKVWNTPALFGPYLLVRNDREAVLLELPVAGV